MNKKFLILGNMGNSGYAVTKQLRAMNIDVDLAINESDSALCFPEWEETTSSTNVDFVNLTVNNVKGNWKSPSWIRYFDLLSRVPRKKFLYDKIKSRIKLVRMIREYDIVVAHNPYYTYSQFTGVPYLIYDTGTIRYYPFGNNFFDKLARRGYKKAKGLIITNPDTFDVSDKLSFLDQKCVFFTPFSIDPEKYKPKINNELREKFVNSDELLLFSPTRQDWKAKGNDMMIKAYAQFSKEFPKSKFILVGWSTDEQKSKELVQKMGLTEKIIWIKPVSKNELIRFYNIADIVLDQFILGSWGSTTPEAMSCEKPVLMFYNKKHIIRAFGEEPPVLNSSTENEILENLLKLACDKKFRTALGIESRKWIIKTHSPEIVGKKHLEIFKNILN